MMSTSIERPGVAEALHKAGRVVVVMPGYAAPGDGEKFADGGLTGNGLAQFLNAIRSPALRQHVLFYRDFYANPRSDKYMMERLSELSAACSFTTLVLPAATVVPAEVSTVFGQIKPVEPSFFRNPKNVSGLCAAHDAVLLVHADALGLGLGPLERQLVRHFGDEMFVLNGRQRLYRLDARMRRALARRRVFAHTRIAESIFARLVPLVGGALALLDRLTARRTS